MSRYVFLARMNANFGTARLKRLACEKSFGIFREHSGLFKRILCEPDDERVWIASYIENQVGYCPSFVASLT